MTRRSGLGRGLDALLPSGGAEPGGLEQRAAEGPLREVDPVLIDPNPRQPRQTFDDEALGELADSIQALGVLQPLLVRPGRPGRYELVAGERRLRASQRAGLVSVPVLVVETDDEGSLERALVENVHRENLNPIEEAAAYRQLMDEGGLTQESLGEKLGRNRVTITNTLRLLDLPTEVQQYLIEGRMTAGHGRALLGLNGNPFQARLAARIVHEGLSVRETEEQVRRLSEFTSGGTSRRGRRPQPPEVTEAQRSLSEQLQARVRVDLGARKGKIVIEFSDLDELDRLRRVIAGEESGGRSATAGPE